MVVRIEVVAFSRSQLPVSDLVGLVPVCWLVWKKVNDMFQRPLLLVRRRRELSATSWPLLLPAALPRCAVAEVREVVGSPSVSVRFCRVGVEVLFPVCLPVVVVRTPFVVTVPIKCPLG